MKSVKQGRESSFVGGIVSLAAAAFGVFWMIAVISSGGGAFGLFGLFFVLIAVINAVRAFRGAFSKNRPSEWDITDSDEEPDPWNERFGNNFDYTSDGMRSGRNRFCPFCGNEVEDNFEFCNNCGKKLP